MTMFSLYIISFSIYVVYTLVVHNYGMVSDGMYELNSENIRVLSLLAANKTTASIVSVVLFYVSQIIMAAILL